VPVDQIIIKYHDDQVTTIAQAAEVTQMARLSAQAGVALTYFRSMSGDAHVLRLPARMPVAEVERIAARLSALPEVAYAEPDYIMQPMLVPNDPQYSNQWHYYEAYGINLPQAWDISTGNPNIVVAVIDTGHRPHVDLASRIIGGYDFISNPLVANDGDGRDADPQDPGDWITSAESSSGYFAGCPVTNSTWHGTHVAGTIGAVTNNGQGVAGVNWQVKLLSMRVLGKCGGTTSDIADAMRWAAGLSVTGIPANLHPAKVLNLSLGGSGSCPTTYQSAINDVNNAGGIVVVSAGNSNTDASNARPANCNGVITVGATNRSGVRTFYSNYGSVVDISAPGGDGDGLVLSTSNAGTQSPTTDSYAYKAGTSMAAPHVAGVASLIVGWNPTLNWSQVENILKNTAKPFGPGHTCTGTTTCGAGIVNAYAALKAVSTPSMTLVAAPSTLLVGSLSTLTITVTDQLGYPVVNGTVVSFTTNLGSVSPVTRVTTNGVATATLSSTVAGLATVTATVGLSSTTEQVTFTPGPPANLSLIAVPSTLPVGNLSALTATATDQFGNPVAGSVVVSFTTSFGALSNSSATTTNGVATATLSSTLPGTAVVTATVGSLNATRPVTFTPGPPTNLSLAAAPSTLQVGNLSALTATATDQFGNPVINGTVVSFTTNLGSASPVTRVTTNGVATATLSSTVAGLAKVTATVGLSSTTAQVTFTPGPPTNLSLIAAPSTLPVGNLSALTATVTDQFGNPVVNGTAVSFTTNLGSASPVTRVTTNGVATATLSSTLPGTAVVTATVGSLNATRLVTFTPGPPTNLSLAAAPSTLQVGNLSALTATVADQFGNPVANGTVVSFTTNLGSVSPITRVTTNGVATATLSSTVAGLATVTATVSSVSVTKPVTFTAGPPANVALAAAPSTLPVGSLSALTATVTDQFGNPVANGIVVSFSTSLGSASPITRVTTNGVATATLSSTLPGTAVVTATVGSLSTTSQVTFTPGAPANLALAAAPSTLTVGNLSALTATVTDQFGNPVANGTVVSFTTNLGIVSPITRVTTNGVATATLSSTVAGLATVTATVGGLSATAQVTFTPGPPANLALAAAPSTLPVGSLSTLTATVTDQFGNPVANGIVVSFSTSLGSVSPITRVTTNGVATATLSSTLPGTAVVTATVGSLSATSQVTFTPGAPANLALAAAPSTLTVGSLSALTATATDQFGNPVANGTVVSFTTNLGIVSPITRVTTNGVATATLSSTVAGLATVTATVGGVSVTKLVTFTAGPPANLALVAAPSTLPVGSLSALTATVTDQFGNPVANGTVVSFTTNLGSVSPITRVTTNGVATATLSSTLPGTAVVTATVGSLSTTAQVTFTPGAPANLALAAAPSTLPVGNLSMLTATVTDQFGNPVANGTVVSFTTNLGSVSPITRVTTNGVATATLSSTVAGLATVTATVGGLSATAQVTFTPGPPANLALAAAPSTLPVGNLSTLTATVTDQFGNPVVSGIVLSFSTSLGSASPITRVTTNGVATATLSSTLPGTAVVTATVGSLSATAQVTFTPGAPANLALVAMPSTLPVDDPSTLTATVTDQFGNPVADGTLVSFSTSFGALSNSNATTLGGMATVTLSSTLPGTAVVTATVGSLSATAQVTFTPGAPANLALAAAPSTLTVGNLSALTVTVTDQFGNLVADGTLVSFSTNLGSASPTAATTINGVATATLSSTIAGLATVTATASGVSATAQVTFTPDAPANLALVAMPSTLPVDDPSTLTATVTDQFGNPVADGTLVSFSTSFGALSNSNATTLSGMATVMLSSTLPGTAVVTATVGSLSATAQVTFTPGPPANLALAAAPSTLTVGNLSALTVTVTDQFGNLVADGTLVSFSTNLGSASPTAATTINGVATATLSSTIAGLATVTATAGDVSATAQVTFTPDAPANLALVAMPSTLPVDDPSTLTAIVTDQFGNPVADGTLVSFSTSFGALSNSNATTLGGMATVMLSSTLPGTAVVTATLGSLSAAALVTFTPGAPANLSLIAAPSTLQVGNLSALTATVTDQFGNLVADGTPVSFSTNLGVATPAVAVTVNGVATAVLSSTVAGLATVTATVGSLSTTALVTFTHGPAAQLLLTATPALIFSNGISQSTVVATVRDAFGNPVPGAPVQFLATSGQLSPTSGASDPNGQVTTTVTSLVPAAANIFALHGSLMAQTPVTYRLPPAWQLSLNSSLTVVTRTLDAVRKNDLITYTMTITNSGNGIVSDILLMAPIPNGTTCILDSINGGSFTSANLSMVLGPQAAQNAVVWSGNLGPGAVHTLSYAVRVLILEGQIVNQPRVHVNNEDTGIDLSSTVQVEAYKAYLPIGIVGQLLD
jgi:subtilisin family serine protease/protocatechuate 3,4-dioxygenase beta subunit